MNTKVHKAFEWRRSWCSQTNLASSWKCGWVSRHHSLPAPQGTCLTGSDPLPGPLFQKTHGPGVCSILIQEAGSPPGGWRVRCHVAQASPSQQRYPCLPVIWLCPKTRPRWADSPWGPVSPRLLGNPSATACLVTTTSVLVTVSSCSHITLTLALHWPQGRSQMINRGKSVFRFFKSVFIMFSDFQRNADAWGKAVLLQKNWKASFLLSLMNWSSPSQSSTRGTSWTRSEGSKPPTGKRNLGKHSVSSKTHYLEEVTEISPPMWCQYRNLPTIHKTDSPPTEPRWSSRHNPFGLCIGFKVNQKIFAVFIVCFSAHVLMSLPQSVRRVLEENSFYRRNLPKQNKSVCIAIFDL